MRRGLGYESKALPCLPNAVGSSCSLEVILGIEVRVHEYDSVCPGQVEALTTRSSAQQKYESFLVL